MTGAVTKVYVLDKNSHGCTAMAARLHHHSTISQNGGVTKVVTNPWGRDRNMEVHDKNSHGCTPNGSVKVARSFNFFPRWGRDERMGGVTGGVTKMEVRDKNSHAPQMGLCARLR